MAANHTIGALANATGVKVPTIRYYEQVGLMPPAPRTSSNRRLYGERDVARLRFIRHARELGFEVDDIKQLLSFVTEPSRSCSEVDAIARDHLNSIDSRIRRLKALRKEVSRMIESCGQGTVAKCRIIDVLAHHEQCMHERH